MEASYPSMEGETAGLITKPFSQGEYCVRFAYHMNGRGIGSLSLFRSLDVIIPFFHKTGNVVANLLMI